MIHCLLHFKVSVPQCNCEEGANGAFLAKQTAAAM